VPRPNGGYRRFLATTGENGFVIDRAKAEEDARFDGIFVLRTNTDLAPLEVMLCYKQLTMVEQTFRTAKSLFATRPIFHKLDETIRGHVSCRHQPIPVQGKWLGQVVSGYFNYHAVPTNSRALHAFRHFVAELWQRSLRRRSQKDGMTWERFTQLANDWLPQPRILHPWPERRFAVRYPRWEPYARIGPVRLCAGGAQQ
jgi:hypothetical protein